MNRSNSDLLTNYEFIFTLIGCIIAVGLLALPNSTVSIAKQDAWVSVIIGAIYPFYIVSMSAIMIKKYPNMNIMELSVKFFGKIFGNLLNFLFMAQFLLYGILVIGAAKSMLRTYAVWFMSPFKIVVIYVLLVVYGTTKGLKVLARINVLAFMILIFLLMTSSIAFTKGSFLNLQPVLDSGFDKIIKGSITSAFAYANMELIMIIHPSVENKNKIIKMGFITVIIILLIYVWTVLTALLYFGPDIVPKSFWPFYFISESIRVPIINNFRFVLIIFWPLIMFKTIATEYYAAAFIMENITGINYRKWCIYLAPLLLYFPLLIKNEVARREFIDLVIPKVTVFNITYITIVALIVLLKPKKLGNRRKGIGR